MAIDAKQVIIVVEFIAKLYTVESLKDLKKLRDIINDPDRSELRKNVEVVAFLSSSTSLNYFKEILPTCLTVGVIEVTILALTRFNWWVGGIIGISLLPLALCICTDIGKVIINTKIANLEKEASLTPN